MVQTDTIDHLGEVVSIRNNRVKVLLRSASACSSCHAKGACSAADFQDKYIVTKVADATNYSKGEKVYVSCNDKQGFFALFWAYVFPMILVVALLFIGYVVWDDELKAGLLSLGILPIYYFLLYFKKTYFDNKLHIKIKKITA
ncbi:RseC/MucC-like positive regulator of sigma(E) [Balneicella halophila]|uniref:RseC/MucC-like positive regulator of sigma(E) n=1 Tax=Balneicella halophila TaxID=1537566 RepID=A0A7L4US13_BALHA|nr:SoxR reducing system RseC family protein [Balneicella halophila]PVX52568.1 RseC/MucC-like positive regulator of sigma(E) [Balneicella halophila]